MNNDLEFNFIQNQLNANNQVRAIIQQEITTLLNLVHQKRQWLSQLDEQDRQLNFRANTINDGTNKTIVKHAHLENW